MTPRGTPVSCEVVGTGPAVLLLHGLGGDGEQAKQLLSASFSATRIVPELPGHGRTELLEHEDIGFAPFASLIADLVDELLATGRIQAGPVPVVGVSMGAGIAVTLAARRADLVRTLVLVRPAWVDVPAPDHLEPFRIIAELLQHRGPEAGLAAFRASECYVAIERQSPAMAHSLLGQFARPQAQQRARVLAEMPTSVPLLSSADDAALDVDTLVLAAPGDPVHPTDVAITLSRWIDRSRLLELPVKLMDPTAHQRALQQAVAAELRRLPEFAA